MTPKPRLEAVITGRIYCEKCGYPVVDITTNAPFLYFKDANKWDWWYYCSNKMCEHHDGEGYFQNRPDWVFDISEEEYKELINS